MSGPPRPSACLVVAEEVWGSALHAVRSLAGAGVPTYVATAGRGAAVYGRSRGCAAAADFDVSDPIGFSQQVVRWVDGEFPGDGPVVVLPLSDRLVEVLSLARSSFPERFRLAIPRPDIVPELISKHRSFGIADRAGLDVPAWISVASADEIPAVEALELPVAVRPTAWDQIGEQYFKVEVCRDRAALHECLHTVLARGAHVVVQEFVEAGESDVEFGILWRSRDRATTAICTGRKRRQSAPDGGVMVWGETAALPEVAIAAEKFLDESGFTGLGGIEFIRARGRLRFIEFNPRLEAIHFLAARAGVDTVVMNHADLAWGLTPGKVPEQQHAAAWVGSAWLTRLLGEPGTWRQSVADRAAFARAPRRVRAVWSWSDPGPGLAVGARLASRASSRAVTELRARWHRGTTAQSSGERRDTTEGSSR